VRKGDTLGEIALQYRPDGVSFHQMLIALQRANEDAFIRDNINLVRAGRILDIPDAQTAAAVDAADASRLVIAQHADFAEYRSRLGTAVAAVPAPAQAAERAAAGQITAKSEEPKPAAATDQLKLSKADPKKPGAPAAAAAREDDLAARQRALQEAQSRVTELEKNVADLQKLLEMRNQQLAQLEQKAAAKPAASAAPKPAPAAKAPEPAPAAPPPAKPVAEAPKPAAAAPKPAAEAAKPAAQPAQTVPAAKPKPKPRPMTPPPPPPEPSLVDEFLGNPVALGGLGAVVLLLGGYGAWAWQRKKKSISKFQDSVLGPASVAPAVGAAEPGLAGAPSVSQSSVSQSAVGGMDTDDVDPIAEADVYMAYGRDAQAEEILKEALQKDPNRVAVLAKLLEIYANRRDAQSFEQHALKLKSVTHGTGTEWEKASALGRSVDPGNGLYGGSGVAPVAAVAVPVAAAAPAVDFDIGGGTAGGTTRAAEAPSALDLDLGGASVPAADRTDFSPSGTLIIDTQESKAAASGLDFDLGGGTEKADSTVGGLNFELPGASTGAAEPTPTPPPAGGGGLDFDLNLGGEAKADEAPAMDLSTISLDLGTAGDAPAAGAEANADPKWQEVATKLDLAKAYEEMGDKDGARELLNEVVREGDAAQQGQAQQLLAKLG
jgi:pilus assembly protein FimV